LLTHGQISGANQSWSRQSLTDSFFLCRGYPRPPEALAFILGPRKSGTDSFRNDRPFELGKYAHHLEHRRLSPLQ
jgi:hypothetical protein